MTDAPQSDESTQPEQSPEGDTAVAALRRAIDRGDLGSATRVVEKSWFPLLSSGLDRTREILSALPLAALRSEPLLSMLLGVTYYGLRHRRAKALQYFSIASVAARSRKERVSDAERALILAGESVGLRLFGQQALAVGPARASLRALDAMSDDRSSVIGEVPRVFAHLGMSLYYGGHAIEALDVFAKGLAESEPTEVSGFGNLSMLAGIHALDGDIHAASEYVDLARGNPWTDHQRAMYTGSFYRLAEAVIALEAFDAETATAHLQAMKHDRATIEHWIPIARVEAMTSLVSGNAAGALEVLERFAVSRGAGGRSSGARARLASVRVLLHLALGNIDAAVQLLRGDASASPQTAVDHARLALVLGHTSAALRHLRSVAGASQSSRTRAEALVIDAAVQLRLSQSSRHSTVIDQLGSLLRGSGQRLALSLVQPSDFGRLRVALVGHGYTEFFEDESLRPLLAASEVGLLLSRREREVLRVLERTGSATQIASELFVSVNTVKSQVKSIYRKLGVKNREDALAAAIARHLLIEAEDE